MIKQRQHYVSRYYLKAWTNEKEQISCLRANKIFTSNLMGVAQERFFYELQDLTKEEIELIYKFAITPSPKNMQQSYIDFLEQYLFIFNFERQIRDKVKDDKKQDFESTMNIMKKNFEEDYHAQIESIGHKYLDLIRDKDIGFYYNQQTEDRMIFLFFITLQYMRTKKRRNNTINEFKNDNINMSKIWPFMAHIYAQNIALSLHMRKEYILILLINNANCDFITGDQPLVNTYGVGNIKELKEDELEFYYPISPKLAVLITKNITNQKKIIISEDNKIQKYNDMIVESKEEQIYAMRKENLEVYKV